MANKPIWREWGESLVIVLVIAFVVRSFIVAPFKIPSSSMVPTLDVGDYIFVLRYSYGLRIPFTSIQLLPSPPKRGDVVVFNYPKNPSIDFIKRVIGLPGDVIDYKNNYLYINGHKMPLEKAGSYSYFMGNGVMDVSELFHEHLPDVTHDVLRKDVSIKDGEWKVPPGEYFMLGDNRNNSEDSRFWGFVPQSYLVGRAAIVWWSWDKEKDAVRWDRLGKIIR